LVAGSNPARPTKPTKTRPRKVPGLFLFPHRDTVMIPDHPPRSRRIVIRTAYAGTSPDDFRKLLSSDVNGMIEASSGLKHGA